ncbi:MAG: hypothetical protein JNK89_02325, partial [Saprospiraceae bacterium]|nr:hypothetical protein [Saprospiraceae bacterium]
MATTYEYRQYKQGLESYYHFVVSGLAIPVTANGKVSLGTLTVHPAILQNQSWSVQLRLIDEGKARQESGEYLGSTTACSALPLDLTAKVCSHSGDEPCGTSPVLFKIWTPENVSVGCPSTKKVKVGLVAANP